MVPTLDIHCLAALGDDLGDQEFLRETVGIYLSELPSRQAAMRIAGSDRDRRAAKDLAHSLGSASAMLGLLELASCCRDVEHAAINVDDAEFARLLDDWLITSERAREALTSWLASPQAVTDRTGIRPPELS